MGLSDSMKAEKNRKTNSPKPSYSFNPGTGYTVLQMKPENMNLYICLQFDDKD